MKMMKMTLKKQRKMRMKRRKCCYQAWRGKRRCTPCSCVLQRGVEPRALEGGSARSYFSSDGAKTSLLFSWGRTQLLTA